MTAFPVPPFTGKTALQRVQFAEDAWNTKDPDIVLRGYSENTYWRNRDTFLNGHEEVRDFLTQKWERELEYKLKKELWSYTDNKIGVRFIYEWKNKSGHWFRSYGNEMWRFGSDGRMTHRYASINDLPISEEDRVL